MNSRKSDSLFRKAQTLLPGGVNSPVRAFKSVGRGPLFVKKAKGALIWDVDGNKFIDYVGSWGPMILGHAHPKIVSAVKRAANHGTSFGAPTELEVAMAELITECVPSIDVVRMVNSGTEATMSAVRLARAFTGREKIIKFEGCYHGHGDSFLIKAGSGAMTLGVPDSPGVPAAVAGGTLTATYNNLPSVEELMNQWKNQVAAVIVEPVVGNMGCVPPEKGFLDGLRSLCDRHSVVLIFDEVMTGFRVALGGAQELYGIKPDLTTLGKIIGGGLPVGAYGGRKDIMSLVAPAGPVYQAGTLSGNPLAMSAGYEMLTILKKNPSIYTKLEKSSATLEAGFRDNIKRLGLSHTLNRVGSMFTLFFTNQRVKNFATAKSSNTAAFAAYFNSMLEQGVYLPPSQFEAAFLSASHSDQDVSKTVRANFKALQKARAL
ncbi:MAG: glutamate-1-semialdehyde 2,1-aminomutase [Bacteroidota bacterium]